MIVVDSSVIIAIMLQEADAQTLWQTLDRAEAACIAAPSVIEIMAVAATKYTGDARNTLGRLMAEANIRIAPFDETALHHALDALMRYGKGRHAAKLNFGDCISYGLAKALDVALLFKGDDFALTDIKQA